MTPIVECEDLTKHYGPSVGLEGLDLTVGRGEVLGFLGPNGAGKTTTIRLLLDLLRPTRGRARVFGTTPLDPAVRGRIGYLPGELELDDRLTGTQMLAFLGRLRSSEGAPVDPRRRGELCERLRLTGRDLGRLIRDNSRGTKQKIGLVAAFQHDPDLLVLDEPTSGLDPLVREAVFELLLEAGAAGRTVFQHVTMSPARPVEVDDSVIRVQIPRLCERPFGQAEQQDQQYDAPCSRHARRLVQPPEEPLELSSSTRVTL